MKKKEATMGTTWQYGSIPHARWGMSCHPLSLALILSSCPEIIPVIPLNRVNLGNPRVRFEKTKPILTTA
jgi:hypothetical protein